MSSHQTSSNKPRSSKCRHFCFVFDTHNYCPTCREAGKGDDPCVTNEKLCNICSAFSEEQLIKIKHRAGIYMLESKKCLIPVIHLKMMIWTCWGMTRRLFLDLKQILRVLQKTYFHLLQAPNPYVLSLCL